MKNEVQFASITKRSPAYLRGARLRSALLLAPFALSGLAGAQDIEGLAGTATSGGDAVKAAVLTIAGIVVTIGLLVWGASKLKPKG